MQEVAGSNPVAPTSKKETFGVSRTEALFFPAFQTTGLNKDDKIKRKESIKRRIVETVTLVTRATMQTYVDEIKQKNADGKLTKEEAAEALRRTVNKSLEILKRDGIEVGRDVLEIVVEAVVGRIKDEKKGGLKEAA